MKTLKQIAKETKPVKDYLSTFLPRYERLFDPIRNERLTILEIGIGGYKDQNKGGGSLSMWAEYFQNSTICGLDIQSKTLAMSDNVKIEQGSQTDINLLNSLAIKYCGFDIVIDDASHVTEYTITTFEALRNHTRLFYIIEDLHMSKAKGTREHFQSVSGTDFLTNNMCVIKL